MVRASGSGGPPRGVPFAKLEAAGNAYLAVDGRELDCDWGALARAMARPHVGVGSDGLVVALRSDVAAVRMRVFNSDGSEAEMSGNGVRLLAKFVLDRGIAEAGPEGLRVETAAGLRTVLPTREGGRIVGGRVAMGVPVVHDADRALRVGDETLRVTTLSLGNPHAVLLLETPVEAFPLAELGPRVALHEAFPGRTNFEIVNVLATDRLRARVFERGEGETPSSGTGSTACAVAARVHGRTGPAVRVELPGGALEVAWPGRGEAFLAGPTREVFTGTWPGEGGA